MKREIRTVKFDFSGKDTQQTASVEFDGTVSSAFVTMTGFHQEFSDSGQNIRTAAANVQITRKQVSIVDLTAELNFQPTNKSNMKGWIEAIVIAELEK